MSRYIHIRLKVADHVSDRDLKESIWPDNIRYALEDDDDFEVGKAVFTSDGYDMIYLPAYDRTVLPNGNEDVDAPPPGSPAYVSWLLGT